MPPVRSLPAFALLVFAVVALAACEPPLVEPAPGAITDPLDLPVGPYDATVRWTSWGIPHVLADDWGSAGYATGWAHARDHACTLAMQIVKVRSERARYFGRGDDDANVDSDFGWLALDVQGQATRGYLSLDADMQGALVGYAAGFNQYLAEIGPSGLPEPCRGAGWVKPMTHVDLLAYYLSLGVMASGGIFIDNIAQASPPDGSRDVRFSNDPTDPEALAAFRAMLAPVREPGWGSNGWGIGGDLSAEGGGMLLSNTHFPYEGRLRWWEFQMTIPPEDVNVYGASLVGIAAVNIGFNEHVAWTHTVSGTSRFTAYALELEPGDPTSYLWDGEYEAMEGRDYSVQVESFGSLATETRTLWFSRFGPVVNAPLVGWTESVAFTFRDGNANNLEMLATWFGMNRATDLDGFRAAHRDINGIPWVHTMYADDAGNAWFTDSATAPLLSEEAWAGWNQYVQDDTFAGLFADNGAILLPGTDPLYEWVEEPGARMPGLVPFDDAPQLERRDFVANANDNHWLSNPAAPLEGLSEIYGDERTPRSPRTRMNLMYLMDEGAEESSGGDGLWTLEELEAAALGGRASMAELLRPAVVARCAAADPSTLAAWPLGGGTVDLTDACALLEAWDGKLTVDSVGAVIWRELLSSGAFGGNDLRDAGALFAVGFDADDPVATPHTLVPAGGEPDPILTALAQGVQTLTNTGIALDARLGDVQFQLKGGVHVPVGGGLGREGAIAISDWSGGAALLPEEVRPAVVNGTSGLTQEGYAVNRGNSWIMAMWFTDAGPAARAVMTYSPSQDPDRPSFDDQSAELYAQGAMRDVLFTEEAIAADPELVIDTLHLDLQD